MVIRKDQYIRPRDYPKMVTVSLVLEGDSDIVLRGNNVKPLRLSLAQLSKSSNVTNAMYSTHYTDVL